MAAAFLLGCNVLPVQEPVDLYQLPPSQQQAATRGPRLPAMRIDSPITSEALSGNRLLIMTAGNRFQAFPGMRLAAPTALLWRDWLLDAYWRDGRVSGLSAASEGLQSSLELGGILRAFQVEHTDDRPAAVIRYDALLINPMDRSIIASKRFEARHGMASLGVEEAVSAMGAAANQLADELIDWTLEQGQVAP
jgi:cholesterol transport system auxiliary component